MIGYTIDYLNVRTGPNTSFPVVITLPPFSKIEWENKQDDWLQLTNGNWVHSNWVQPEPTTEQQKWDLAYEFVAKWEGGFQIDRYDKGNWTGGKVGVGELKGTKYGVSAASYPNLDIFNLTREEAKDIFYNDYWRKSNAYVYDWPMALFIFDSAILHGVYGVKYWLTITKTPMSFLAQRLKTYSSSSPNAYFNRLAELMNLG